MKNKILVVAPHADDEVLGVGGTIRKKVNEGHEVSVIIMTNANKSIPERYTLEKLHKIRAVAVKANEILGVKEVLFEDFPAPVLDQFPAYKIAEALHLLLKKNEYDTIYVPHRGDIHNDHKVIFDAALVAARPVGNYFVKNIYAYETLSETEWAHPYASEVFVPTVFEKIEIDDFEIKLKAMECYDSQVRPFPASRSLESLEALAKYRGCTIQTERAEAFMLIRSIS